MGAPKEGGKENRGEERRSGVLLRREEMNTITGVGGSGQGRETVRYAGYGKGLGLWTPLSRGRSQRAKTGNPCKTEPTKRGKKMRGKKN